MDRFVATNDHVGIPHRHGSEVVEHGDQRLRLSAWIGNECSTLDAREPETAVRMDLGQDLEVVEPEVGEPQTPGRERQVLHGQRVIRCASIHQIEATQGAGQQVDLDATRQASGAAIGGIAAAAPRCW